MPTLPYGICWPAAAVAPGDIGMPVLPIAVMLLKSAAPAAGVPGKPAAAGGAAAGAAKLLIALLEAAAAGAGAGEENSSSKGSITLVVAGAAASGAGAATGAPAGGVAVGAAAAAVPVCNTTERVDNAAIGEQDDSGHVCTQYSRVTTTCQTQSDCATQSTQQSPMCSHASPQRKQKSPEVLPSNCFTQGKLTISIHVVVTA